MTGTHSILAPSDSHRWLRCVGALYLSRGLPDVDAEYNASGACSHWLLQWALEHPDLGLETWLDKTLTFGENPKFDFKIDEQRIERVQSVVNNIRREPGEMLTEYRLNTTPALGVPDQEGHSDIIKAYPEGGVVKDEKLLRGVLSVHDFKDGYILVKAEGNTQGLIYLCAAMLEYDLTDKYEAFRFCIHQPKINHYDEWTYTRAELEAFMQAARPVAKLAYDVYHENVPFDPQAHLVAGEEQCTFCPVRGRCVARAARIIKMFEPIIRRHELDDRSIGLLYAQLDEISAAITDFRSEALRRAKMGVTIEGQKLVYGNHGPRKWVSEDDARTALELLLPLEKVLKPAEVISPTQAELLLKKRYVALKDLVTQSPPQLRLVPLDHKAEAVKLPEFGLVKTEESLV